MKTIISITMFLIIGLSNVNAQTETELTEEICFVMPEAIVLDADADKVRPTIECEVVDYKITVYDLVGDIVFESTDVLEYWNVQDMPAGTYFWTISANLANTVPLMSKKEKGKINISE